MQLFKSDQTPHEKELDPSGGTSWPVLLGLCATGLVLALASAPLFGDKLNETFALLLPEYGIDRTTTASVTRVKKPKIKRYIESRSVLNKNPAKPCRVEFYATRVRDC